jgi:parallel beta-helix repeat protein
MKRVLLTIAALLLLVPSVLSLDFSKTVGPGQDYDNITACLNAENYGSNWCKLSVANLVYIIDDAYTYYVQGISMAANNITIDCNHSKLIGRGSESYGIDTGGKNSTTIVNCEITGYRQGIHIENSANVVIEGNTLYNTTETGTYVRAGILIGNSQNINLSSNTFLANNAPDIYSLNGNSNIKFLTPLQDASIYSDGSSSLTLASYTIGSAGSSQVKYSNFAVSGSMDTQNDFVYGTGFVSVNSASSPGLNHKANVTINDINCANFNLWHASSFYSSLADIMANGDLVATRTNIGGDCTDNSVCKKVQCSGGALTFEAQHFDGFGGGEGVTSTGAGNVSINLTEELSIIVNYNINFGSGRVDAGSNYAILDSDAENATNSTWVFKPQYLYIENDGTVNESINITTDKNASAFLGGTNPGYQVMGIDTEWGACAGTLLDYYFNISTEPQTICDLLQFGIDYDSINASVMLIVPSDAPSGKKESVLTFTAKMV